jgi:hypothetical protein
MSGLAQGDMTKESIRSPDKEKDLPPKSFFEIFNYHSGNYLEQKKAVSRH